MHGAVSQVDVKNCQYAIAVELYVCWARAQDTSLNVADFQLAMIWIIIHFEATEVVCIIVSQENRLSEFYETHFEQKFSEVFCNELKI